ncbi:MAG: hypothetical protein VX107_20285, partial [Pseudomonadota bacterium]|nr:hypothetical protein [Pseudomonadota bacterium]
IDCFKLLLPLNGFRGGRGRFAEKSRAIGIFNLNRLIKWVYPLYWTPIDLLYNPGFKMQVKKKPKR